MGFKCGIVGLPNVGKSTLFNALTNGGIAAENYPFCTIDPNVGMVPVPDPRLDSLAGIVTPEKIIPTTMEFVDIAGLVAGASKGEGLGNQFLSHIREVDAIGHVVRCFPKTMTWCMWMERSTLPPISKLSKPSFSPTWTRPDGLLNGQPKMPKQVAVIWWRAPNCSPGSRNI